MDWMKEYLPDAERLDKIEAGFKRIKSRFSVPDMKVFACIFAL